MKNLGVIVRAASVAALLTAISVTSGAQAQQNVAANDPEVSVNIQNENSVRRIIDFTATPGSYVTVIRVSPVGSVEVLYPAAAVVDRAMIPSTKRVPVPKLWTSSNPRGAGSIFAFVSSTPYVFSRVADNNGWNSLHLANYGDATDAAVAESFGNEISAPGSRVIMSKATTAPVAIITRDHSPTMASLASFRTKPCPTLATQVNAGCVLQGVRLPITQNSKPMQAPAQPQKTVSSK